MPKIFGTSWLGIIAATVAFYLIGFLWYGILFSDQWMAANGITEEAAKASTAAMVYVWGILITLAQVLGLAYILNHASASLLITCAKIGGIIAILIALPLMAYSVLYEGRAINALWIDLAHILIGYVVACTVLSFFRGKETVGD